ncbi:hypothetical protein KNT87_gp104 [Erwinia phage Cronus]|uniref:Uncharacterized protein n=1 Tax=Erwinia phage Cronus TaxID=2163633 RepID=A0A2S1GMG9_9CAUD|nr:hypothetical protein KNT87_gp104 [Erwinia phage Cronus]AWD90543.1 hypothetical protein [Erwinia phage Cronus]
MVMNPVQLEYIMELVDEVVFRETTLTVTIEGDPEYAEIQQAAKRARIVLDNYLQDLIQ